MFTIGQEQDDPVGWKRLAFRQPLRIYRYRRKFMARRTAKAKRKGKALLVYFRKEDAERLSSIAKERRVAKTELVRVAVGRFLNDLNSGQLELPLGL